MMIARRAADQVDTDVTEVFDRDSLAGTVTRAVYRGRPAAQPGASRVLAPRPESVRAAREFTRATLRGWGLAAVSDDAELVVSELVTNALRHGLSGSGAPGPDGSGPVIGLRLMVQAPHLLCMVTDPSREIPRRRDSGPLDATGRGLCVIESCSSRWGWCPLDAGGKVVWALLPGR
jgi:hypothetical protein